MLRSLVIRAATAVAIALTATAAHADQPLRLAVSAGPLAQLVEFVAARAKSKGVDIKIIETTDWVTPNEAVFAGDLDTNFFQHSANLAIQNAVPQWPRTRGWTKALLAFKIHFGDRLPD